MKKTVKDVDVRNKRVLVRVDFNVPLDENQNITDDTRIIESLPTINYLREQNAKVILMSHLGRPKGKPEPKYSLKPVAVHLSKLLNSEVKFAPCCISPETEKIVQNLSSKEVVLLENVRFHDGEEKNDPVFAKELTKLGEIFVQDAFGSVHRAHASTVGVAKLLPSVAGLLLEKELLYFDKALSNPERPFIVILGGAKVSDKIGVLQNLIGKVDALIICGAMAYTFLRAKNISTGASLIEEDKIEVAKEIIFKANERKVKIFLPIDHIVANKVAPDAEIKKIDCVEIPDKWIGVDIGEVTVKRIVPVIMNAKTIIWNGPVGVFEIDKFSRGTKDIANLLTTATEKGITTIVGGGDTGAAVKRFDAKVSHVSTGGGASLALLEGKVLPGIEVLLDN